jgi:hypothetical protein
MLFHNCQFPIFINFSAVASEKTGRGFTVYKNNNISLLHKKANYVCIPAKYATLSGVTSNLSRLCGLATMPSSMVKILVVRDTVVGVGWRKPFSK